MTKSKFKPGDTVFVSVFGSPFKKATVDRVGRKYVYVGQFAHKIDGNGLSTGYAGTIRTEDEHAEAERAGSLDRKLRGIGVDVRGNRFTSDQLTRILAIAEEQ